MEIKEKTAKVYTVGDKDFFSKKEAEEYFLCYRQNRKVKLVYNYLYSIHSGLGKDGLHGLASAIINHKDSIPNLRKVLDEIEQI